MASEFVAFVPVGEAERVNIVTSDTQNGILSMMYRYKIAERVVNYGWIGSCGKLQRKDDAD